MKRGSKLPLFLLQYIFSSVDFIYMTKEIIEGIQNKELIVIKTDTLYGIIGTALDRDVVERIYSIKERNPLKPFIILIHDILELERFNIYLDEHQKEYCLDLWRSEPTSIIFEIDGCDYLHRGRGSLAFRIPQDKFLQKILTETGPLVAPSANPEGKAPARNIHEAQAYFGEAINMYIDGGECGETKASRIVVYRDIEDIDIVRD